MSIDQIIAELEARGIYASASEFALEHGVTLEAVLGRSRTKAVVAARHALWRHVRALGLSYPEIGELFGVDHTSVYQACREEK